MDIELHPLQPFLPKNCQVLFLGSFPPPRKRWSMDFFYPNFINDHWRIEGLLFFNQKDYFVDTEYKTFRLELIKHFCQSRGIGFYDTATAIRRRSDNASDKNLEIIKSTDIASLIAPLHHLKAIAATGELSCQTLCAQLGLQAVPKTGQHISLSRLQIYHLPSSSRAYPMPLAKKAEPYREMYRQIGML